MVVAVRAIESFIQPVVQVLRTAIGVVAVIILDHLGLTACSRDLKMRWSRARVVIRRKSEVVSVSHAFDATRRAVSKAGGVRANAGVKIVRARNTAKSSRRIKSVVDR